MSVTTSLPTISRTLVIIVTYSQCFVASPDFSCRQRPCPISDRSATLTFLSVDYLATADGQLCIPLTLVMSRKTSRFFTSMRNSRTTVLSATFEKTWGWGRKVVHHRFSSASCLPSADISKNIRKSDKILLSPLKYFWLLRINFAEIISQRKIYWPRSIFIFSWGGKYFYGRKNISTQ